MQQYFIYANVHIAFFRYTYCNSVQQLCHEIPFFPYLYNLQIFRCKFIYIFYVYLIKTKAKCALCLLDSDNTPTHYLQCRKYAGISIDSENSVYIEMDTY